MFIPNIYSISYQIKYIYNSKYSISKTKEHPNPSLNHQVTKHLKKWNQEITYTTTNKLNLQNVSQNSQSPTYSTKFQPQKRYFLTAQNPNSIKYLLPNNCVIPNPYLPIPNHYLQFLTPSLTHTISNPKIYTLTIPFVMFSPVYYIT